jgi:4-amino-4-deoxy-L-arabinose transferase-like glycosyltransferase
VGTRGNAIGPLANSSIAVFGCAKVLIIMVPGTDVTQERDRQHPRRAVWETALVATLLALYWWMAISVSDQNSGGFDEIAHLTAGTSFLLHADYRLNPENGLLPQLWAALPLEFSHPTFPSLNTDTWGTSDVWQLGDRFFFHSGNAPGLLLLQGRCMIALLGAATACLVYLWSRSLFGILGAAVSLTLCVFSPTMLAHGGMVTSDMALALTMTAALWAYAWLLASPSALRCLVCGLIFGVLAVAKFSSLTIAPVLLLLLILHLAVNRTNPGTSSRAQLRMAGAALGTLSIAWLAIWAFYGFRDSIANPNLPAMTSPSVPWDVLLATDMISIRIIAWAKTLHVLPEPFLYGLAHVVRLSEPRVTFFLGQQGFHGWRMFFPVAFAVKTTLPFLFVLLLAVYQAATRVRNRRHISPGILVKQCLPFAPILLFLIVFWTFAIISHLNIGHRHLLPIYPLLFILAGVAARIAEQPRLAGRIALLVLVCWHAGESLAARPHYLSYFNELIGSRDNGYKYFVDSSLDWGQDLPALKEWLDGQKRADQDDGPLHLAYFGTSSPEYYGIKSRFLYRFPDHREAVRPYVMSAGVYCLSATLYQGLYLGKWFMKHWDDEAEHEFFMMRHAAQQVVANNVTDPALMDFLARAGTQGTDTVLKRWEDIRFFKLISYLHTRRPDQIIAHTILVFHLNDEEVRNLNDKTLSAPVASL